MHRMLFFAVFFLVLAALACNLQPGGVEPTSTTVPAVTGLETTEAPATEVPATEPPTAEEPTVTPAMEETPSAVSPTVTPLLPTAVPPSPPTILSFTADRMTIVERESVNLTWQATGGTEVFICWVGQNALTACAPGSFNPDGATVTINPDGDGDIRLTVNNSVGSAEAHVQLNIECAHEWVPALAGNPPSGHCPWEAETGPAVQQSFENGFMVWMGPSRTIYVFYNFGHAGSPPVYAVYPDNFYEGDPESDPSIVPPPGLYQPVRGFGLVWRTYPEVRDGLGWATAPEAGFQTWRQGYAGSGMHVSFTMLQGIDSTIYHLEAFGSTWSVYSP